MKWQKKWHVFYAVQIQNLGYLPVRNLQLNIMIPEVTKNGNRFLQIQHFHIDQVKNMMQAKEL